MPTTTQLESGRYRVRQWTAFTWRPDDTSSAQDRTDNLERATAIIRAALLRQCPHFKPDVKVVRVGGNPQLMFELHVKALDRGAAPTAARYWIMRALSTKVPVADRRKITLKPPMGKVEVEEEVADEGPRDSAE